MKVVINDCFGGFSLSPLAIKRMAELQKRDCYFFTHDWKSEQYIPVKLEDINQHSLLVFAFDIPNPNEVLKHKKWSTMTDKQRSKNSNLYSKHIIKNRDYERHDTLLIQVVKELGTKANGQCASLKIVTIPDGTDYEIEEYDGNEHIAEKHRTWS